MDVYLFIQTEPGMATSVMNALVESKAVTRAAAITGKHDVFARIDNVEFDDLGARLVDVVQRTPGVLRTTTAAGLPVSAALSGRAKGPSFPIPTMPLRSAPKQPQALVFLRTQPGMGEAALRKLAQARSVLSLALLTGDYDAVLQIAGPNLEAIARKVMREIHSVPGVLSTTTSLVAAITPLVAPAPARRRRRRRATAARRGGTAARRRAPARKPAKKRTAAKKRTTRRGRR
jgi:DNA-binding Lrp family transcriptional regulator